MAHMKQRRLAETETVTSGPRSIEMLLNCASGEGIAKRTKFVICQNVKE